MNEIYKNESPNETKALNIGDVLTPEEVTMKGPIRWKERDAYLEPD